MININIVIGRFQPFTKGHLKCIEYVKDHFNVPTVLCVIETKKPDTRHPFLSDKLEPCFNALVKHNIIENYFYTKAANIVDISQMLYNKGYNIIYWTCGTDRIDTYSRQLRNYKDKSMVDPACQVIEIPRTDEDISATSARNFLLNNDKKNFEKIVPKEFGFNYLRKIYSGQTIKENITESFQKFERPRPQSKKELKALVEKTIKVNGNEADLNFIDTSDITDMSWLFSNTMFYGNISQWDTSNVTNMCGMFNISLFNGDISNWDVSNVENMSYMFKETPFNQDVHKWDVFNVTDMTCMFGKSKFNKDISNWIINKKCDTRRMFEACPIKEQYKPKIK